MRDRELNLKWTWLARNVRAVGLADRGGLTPRSLARQYFAGRSATRETTEEIGTHRIFGHVTRWKTSCRHWQEVGTAWVAEEFCNRGLLGEMLDELLGKVPPGVRLLAVSDSVPFIHAVLKRGFVAVAGGNVLGMDATAWAAAVGINDRLPLTTYRAAPNPFDGERWLFIRL